jgi:tRNA-splicing ligase RtcB
MLGKHSFVRVAENIWEIPSTFRDDMRVPARVYADEDLLAAALGDNSVVQLVNTATLPGVIKHAIAMPDIHQGYGFPIGGVVATHLAARGDFAGRRRIRYGGVVRFNTQRFLAHSHARLR